MESHQAQQSTESSKCRSGCGFYGSAAFEGHCSQCYKSVIQRTQDAARVTPVSVAPSSSSAAEPTPITPAVEKLTTCAQAALSSEDVTAKLESAAAIAEAAATESAAAVAAAGSSSNGDAPPPAKKANRCQQCRKKVGLTGFTCRCGGLYCGEHRYDKAHGCEFDYKTMEREEIRKNNPVVVSDKIQRI